MSSPVDPAARRRGVGRRLVDALAALARERGCYGMWVGTETENVAARATYERAGARETRPHLILEWNLGDSERRERDTRLSASTAATRPP